MRNLVVFGIALSASLMNVLGQKPAVVTSNEPGWKKIGETTASFKSQNESIHVVGADEFAAIKLKVTDAPLEITRLQVFYESGDMEEIDVKNKIQAGSETRTFRLKHADRDISKVAFTYNTSANPQGSKAKVELMGLKSGSEDSEAYRKSRQTRDDVEEAADEAGDDIGRAAENAAEDAKEARENAEEDIGRESEAAERKLDRKSEKTESDLERAAEKTGDAISKAAADVEATITDKVYEGKEGPKGQKIYIDER